MYYSHSYIYFENIFYILYNWFCICNKSKSKTKEKQCINFEKLMLDSVELKNRDAILYCISNGAKNLNDCLVLACKKGYGQITDLLLEKGADPMTGLRYSTSPNITRTLYRYYQKSENIN